MADALFDVLVARSPFISRRRPGVEALAYLTHLAAQPSQSLDYTEPTLLSQTSHTLLISLQSLSKRCHKAVVDSANRHKTLGASLPAVATSARDLRNAIPRLDAEALRFATTYSKAGENDTISRRKKALLLARNVDRLVDILELPTILSSAISSTAPNYSSALDLSGHIRRLHSIYPVSPLVSSVSSQADLVTHKMAADLVLSLKTPGLKLAASLRTVGWLRRVIPDLKQEVFVVNHGSSDRELGFIFLLCRLATLIGTLGALQPLRQLADDELARQAALPKGSQAWSGGQQTERYLKRYIEIYREHSFGIVSMFKSLFPVPTTSGQVTGDPLQPMPSMLASFPIHLIDMLLDTLRHYLPCIRDQTARDSILTQVLYCAGSLGRLGGDFGLLLAGVCLDEKGAGGGKEWVGVVKRHRLLAGRLESVMGDYKGLVPRET